MATGRIGPNRPKPELEQPFEAMPSLATRIKLQKLEQLRVKIALARDNYRIAPSTAVEIALTKLIREEQRHSATMLDSGRTPR